MLPLLALLLAGCRCGPAPSPPPAAPSHFGEWSRLVRAASMGDAATAKVVARDLVDNVPHDEAEGIERVGGSLGFLQLAEDAEELAEGVTHAATGCGACHGASGVIPRQVRPAADHEHAAGWAVWGLVWGEPGELPTGGDLPEEVVAAWQTSGGDAEERAAALLVACAGCHEDGV